MRDNTTYRGRLMNEWREAYELAHGKPAPQIYFQERRFRIGEIGAKGANSFSTADLIRMRDRLRAVKESA